jgi:hypothetical protein
MLGPLLQAGRRMRLVLAMLACLALVHCATPGDRRFHVGDEGDALVIIGVAESGANTSPTYRMLWRRLNGGGTFRTYGLGRFFEARTNAGGSVRVNGLPGEFILAKIEPGSYALDSVYATIPDGRVVYVANGVVREAERPGFTVRAGEAVYLGIWEVNIDGGAAVARLWRLEEDDMRAVLRESETVVGEVEVRAMDVVSVPCAPYRISNVSQRQVC